MAKYQIDWLAVLNGLADGFTFGLGIALAFLVTVLIYKLAEKLA